MAYSKIGKTKATGSKWASRLRWVACGMVPLVVLCFYCFSEPTWKKEKKEQLAILNFNVYALTVFFREVAKEASSSDPKIFDTYVRCAKDNIAAITDPDIVPYAKRVLALADDYAKRLEKSQEVRVNIAERYVESEDRRHVIAFGFADASMALEVARFCEKASEIVQEARSNLGLE